MKHEIATIDVRGAAYLMRWANLRRHLGDCDPPTAKAPEIRLSHRLKQDEHTLLYIACHEVLHGGAWDLDESAVIEIAKAQRDALWALGYRRVSDD